MNSARGPERMVHNGAIPKKVKQKINRSMDDDSSNFDSNDNTSMIMILENQDLVSGCECDRNPDSLYCLKAEEWLKICFQDKFENVIFQKTYEGFLLNSPKLKYLRT